MIMWEFTSGIPPFSKRAHDHQLILSICKGERPEIIKNIPKCYIALMEKCWNSDPIKRPTIMDLENIISQWLRYVNEYYIVNGEKDNCNNIRVVVDNYQLRSDMYEFVNANKAISQGQVNSFIHPQACYTSRLITEILEQKNSECLDCIIEN
ncbi:hypothetical protein C1645_880097 [Glomus cerebriforme]|uniref:Serine-threonine/tyrosine-protein kinase catalytic domain-containing protein n=1 Tax=Glomus cerebriforme TaxID=658196 RepID=A0A397SGY0_9GLOM|nr:hypothetical protein C1645_880097 [Glomus cerebriforme]